MCTFIRGVAPSFICLPLFLWLVFLSTSRLFLYFPDIFKSGFWNFDQDALQDGSIQGLADRLKTTVLSAKANSTSLLYYRAYRKWKQFAICMFGGGFLPAKLFYVALYFLIEQTHSPSVIDAAFYGIKWAHSLAGIPSPMANPIVEAVRSASKRILGTAAVNRKEPILSRCDPRYY